MKLIDLLVQELPKRGGWPEGVAAMAQDTDGDVKHCSDTEDIKIGSFITGRSCIGGSYSMRMMEVTEDQTTAIVTREQYEAALAAAQQPVWDGEGLPPVGCECERSWTGDKWLKCKILFISNETAVVKMETGEAAYHLSDITFRPICSGADKRRDEAIAALKKLKPQLVGELAGFLYDGIAAGKIPHIRIE
ncbi:hypothetical protein SNN70_004054 [Cronobacter malonaticus]|nr:hypothetical protein [Cronobacter malonaticus]